MGTLLTDATWEPALRMRPMALVAFVAPWCTHCKSLEADLVRLADAFTESSVLFGHVSGGSSQELLDRFDVTAFPTLLWFDGSKRWPFRASEARPSAYAGLRHFEAMSSWIAQRGGVRRGSQPEPSGTAPIEPLVPIPPSPSPQPLILPAHACSDASAQYVGCMQLHRLRMEACATQRRAYLLCMSSRWAVHPDHHAALAGEYARFVVA